MQRLLFSRNYYFIIITIIIIIIIIIIIHVPLLFRVMSPVECSRKII